MRKILTLFFLTILTLTSQSQSQAPSADFDGDSIPNNLDIDSDNDGIPNEIEQYNVVNRIKGILDGNFEEFENLAGNYTYNSNVTKGGWKNGYGTCDTWEGVPTSVWALNGKPSPAGGVYAGCWSTGSYHESFTGIVTGLNPGVTYQVTFYQLQAGQFGEYSGKAAWQVKFGDTSKLSPYMENLGQWQKVSLNFTATKSTQTIELSANYIKEETYRFSYMMIDDIQILERINYVEFADYDSDGLPNILDWDSDNDGCPDHYESGVSKNTSKRVGDGPYGKNGLANDLEDSDSYTPNLTYDETYNFAIDSNTNKCLECEGISSSYCNYIIQGNAYTACGEEVTNTLQNIDIYLVDESGRLIEQTKSDENGAYFFKVPEGMYFVQFGISNTLTLFTGEIDSIENHANENQRTDTFRLNQEYTFNGIFEGTSETPIIDGLPTNTFGTCNDFALNSKPYISNIEGVIHTDTFFYRTEDRLDSVKYVWTATALCGSISEASFVVKIKRPDLRLSLDTVFTCSSNTLFTATFSDTSTIQSIEWISSIGSFSQADSQRTLFSYDIPGEYALKVKATDQNGCSVIVDTTIVVKEPTSGSEIKGQTSYCERDTLMLYPSIKPKSVTWIRPNGQQVDSDSLIIPDTKLGHLGNYTMITTVEGGCKDTITQFVQVNRSSIPTIIAPTTICKGLPINLSTNGSSTSSYSWSYNEETFGTEKSSNYSTDNLEVGKHTFSLQVIPEIGCSGFSQTTVEVLPAFDFIPPNDTTLCAGENLSVSFSDIKTGFWFGPKAFFSNSPTLQLQDIQTHQSGVYTYAIESQAGCSVSDSFMVNVIPIPTYLIIDSVLSCDGSSVKFSTDLMDSTATWTFGNTTITGNTAIFDTKLGLDSVVYMPNQKCANPETHTFTTVDQTPVIEVQKVNQTCDKIGSIAVTILSSTAIYHWQDLPEDSMTLDREVNQGVYTLWVEDQGCQAVKTVTIEDECPEVLSTILTLDIKDQCTNAPISDFEGELYSSDSSFVKTISTDSLGKQALTIDQGTYYIVFKKGSLQASNLSEVQMNDNLNTVLFNANTDTLAFRAFYSDYATLTLGAGSVVCSGDTLRLSSNQTKGLFSWAGPNNFESTEKTPIIENIDSTAEGVYTLKHAIGNCVQTDSFEVKVDKKVFAVQTNSPICSGQDLEINSTLKIELEENLSNTSGTELKIPDLPTGIYDIDVKPVDECYADMTLNVEVKSLNYQASPDISDCEADTFTLFATNVENGVWTGPNGFKSTSLSTKINIADSSNWGTYEFKGQSVDGCPFTHEVNVNSNLDCVKDENIEGNNDDSTNTDDQNNGNDVGTIDDNSNNIHDENNEDNNDTINDNSNDISDENNEDNNDTINDNTDDIGDENNDDNNSTNDDSTDDLGDENNEDNDGTINDNTDDIPDENNEDNNSTNDDSTDDLGDENNEDNNSTNDDSTDDLGDENNEDNNGTINDNTDDISDKDNGDNNGTNTDNTDGLGDENNEDNDGTINDDTDDIPNENDSDKDEKPLKIDTLRVEMNENGFEFCLGIEKETSFITKHEQSSDILKEESITGDGCITMNGYTEEPTVYSYKVCFLDNTCDTITVEFRPKAEQLILEDDYYELNNTDLDILDPLNNDYLPNGYDSIRLINQDSLMVKTLFDGTLKIENTVCNQHILQYIIYDGNRADTATIELNISCDLEITNGISRNGDGMNDGWKIFNIENYPENTVYVFNRYGNIVFNKKGYTNAFPWQGTFRGEALPSGTYFYIVKQNQEHKGQSGYLILH